MHVPDFDSASTTSGLNFTSGLKKFTRKTVAFGEHSESKWDGHEEEVYIREMNISQAMSTGCALWDASIIMSRFVRAHHELFIDQNVMELGSGCGLLGIMVARYAARVVLSDGTSALVDNLKYNIQINTNLDNSPEGEQDEVTRRKHKLNVIKAAQAQIFEYSDPDTLVSNDLKHSMDIMIGSEIVYTNNAQQIAGLCNAVKQLLKPDGVFYMIQSTDRRSRSLLIQIFSSLFHFSINTVPEAFLGNYGTKQRYEVYEMFTFTLKRETDPVPSGEQLIPISSTCTLDVNRTVEVAMVQSEETMPNGRTIAGGAARPLLIPPPKECDVPAKEDVKSSVNVAVVWNGEKLSLRQQNKLRKKQASNRPVPKPKPRSASSSPDNLALYVDDPQAMRGLFGDSDTE